MPTIEPYRREFGRPRAGAGYFLHKGLTESPVVIRNTVYERIYLTAEVRLKYLLHCREPKGIFPHKAHFPLRLEQHG